MPFFVIKLAIEMMSWRFASASVASSVVVFGMQSAAALKSFLRQQSCAPL